MIALFWYVFITLLLIFVWGTIVLTNNNLPPTIPSERGFVFVIVFWPWAIIIVVMIVFFFIFKWLITGKKQ